MNTIKFLGTAGARFVVSQQLRKSGGIWLTLDNTNVLIDPGPGTLIRCLSSKPKLNPRNLDGIILTHRHLDHSNDINLMMEAMTNGGWDKKGTVFSPKDALDDDPVILRYVRKYVENIEVLKEKGKYKIGNISFTTPVKHPHHSVETYGLNIYGKKSSISFISDTAYFKGIEKYYTEPILIINVVFLRRMQDNKKIDHLTIADAEKIIQANKPKIAIMTHFGMTMVKSKPWELAEKLSEKLGVKVVAASDGMQINLDEY
jgi:ribonuclease BN (tRNA processing enzyme)